MLGQKHSEKLFEYYNSPAIVAGYGQQEYLTPGLFITDLFREMQWLQHASAVCPTSQFLADILTGKRTLRKRWREFRQSAPGHAT
jgi:hypothetical protein